MPFDVFILSSKNVKEESSFMAEIDIQLPKEANETVEIKYIGSISISSNLPQLDYECESYSGFRISPGERKTVIICSFSVSSIRDKGGGGSKEKEITISVPQGIIVGESDSGNIYFNKPASKTIRVT